MNKPQLIQAIESIILPLKLYFDKDVPFSAKLFPTLIFITYLLVPIDFIADFLPIAGSIDDLAVFTACAYLLVKLTPDDILEKYSQPKTTDTQPETKKIKIIESKSKRKQ